MAHDGLAAGEGNPADAMVERKPDTERRANSANEDLWKRWQDNSPAIIAILSVAVVAIRLLGVARGDPQIAYAILQAGGTGNVLIGTLVSTLGLLAIPGLAAFGLHAFGQRKEKSHVKFHVLLAGSLAMLYIALYMAPVDFLVLSIVEALAVKVILERRKEGSTWDGKKILSLFICVYVSVVLLFELASPTPWLPIQAISEGQQQFSGYILSQADGQTTILTYNPDEVISVPSQRLLAAQCKTHYYIEEQATIVYVIERAIHKLTDYPACPSASYRQSSLSPRG